MKNSFVICKPTEILHMCQSTSWVVRSVANFCDHQCCTLSAQRRSGVHSTVWILSLSSRSYPFPFTPCDSPAMPPLTAAVPPLAAPDGRLRFLRRRGRQGLRPTPRCAACLPVTAAAMAVRGGHRIRLLHSFSVARFPRRHEAACCVRNTPGPRRSPRALSPWAPLVALEL